MFKADNNKLGSWEFFAIFMFTIAIQCTESMSVIFIRSGGTGAWIMPVISYLTTLIPFLLLQSLLKKNVDKSLFDLINMYTGKYIGFIINNILCLLILGSLIITSRSYIFILNAMYFPSTPDIALYICLICICCYGVIKGISIVGRACLVALPYIFIAMVLLVFSIWRAIDYRLALPIGGTGIFELLKNGVQYSSVLGGSIIFSVFFSSARDYNKYKVASNMALLASVLCLVFFHFAFLAIFGFYYLKIINYPFHELMRVARLGETIQNIEAFFLFFWIIGIVLHLSIYFCALDSYFSDIYKLKSNKFFNNKLFTVIFAIIIILVGVNLNDKSALILNTRSLQLKISSCIILTLPIILFIASKLKGGGNK